MKSGFGWVQAKPPCSMAPFAITPDELGDSWRDGRCCADLLVDWSGQRFGAANGEPMGYGCHELVAHACRTRDLVAGTVIGIDYGIVLEGEIELELDDGANRTVRQGGIIVQRGTNHPWRNTSDRVCRIAFILIEAPAYLHNGQPLPEDRPEDSPN